VQLKVNFVNIFQQHSFDFELNLLIFGQSREQNSWVVQF